MANSTHPVPHILGPGAAAIKLRALASGLSPHGWCPPSWWSQRVTAAQLVSLGTTSQTSILSVDASGFTEGTISLTFSGAGISTVTLTGIVAETDEDATATNIEAAIAAARLTTLDGIVADESVTDNDVTIEFEDGIGWVTVTPTFVPTNQTWTVQFGGTAANGNYDTTLSFEGYDPIVIRTTRAAGTPADDAALAVQHEADIEGDSRLTGLVVSADDDGADLCTIIAEPDAPDLTVTCSAPGTGTLTPDETTGETTFTFAHDRSAVVDVNAAFPSNAVWSEVDRCWAGVYVIDAFDTGVTVDLGDTGAATAVLSDVSLATEGWTSDTGNAQSDDHHEPTWAPLLTVDFGDADDTASGEFEIWVVLRKHQTGTW